MSNSLTFLCPGDLIEVIKVLMSETGRDKTSVVLEMLGGLPSIGILERSKLPESEAVYLAWTENSLLYIGQTKNLRQRFVSHHRMNEFINAEARLSWFDINGDDRLILEESLIEALEPALNGTTSPAHEGRVTLHVPNDMYLAVQRLAIEDGAKIHHISKNVTMAPTIVKLVELALEILRERPS
jgi:GIY-YIG catalytic domain